jgi:hypothetical protein
MTPSGSRRRLLPGVTLKRALTCDGPLLKTLCERAALRPLPRRIETGAYFDFYPISCGFPQTMGGWASTWSFSRSAKVPLALRPARLLNRPDPVLLQSRLPSTLPDLNLYQSTTRSVEPSSASASRRTREERTRCAEIGCGNRREVTILDGARWNATKPDFFLPVLVLSRLFRRLMLEKLSAAHAASRLSFFGAQAPPQSISIRPTTTASAKLQLQSPQAPAAPLLYTSRGFLLFRLPDAGLEPVATFARAGGRNRQRKATSGARTVLALHADRGCCSSVGELLLERTTV